MQMGFFVWHDVASMCSILWGSRMWSSMANIENATMHEFWTCNAYLEPTIVQVAPHYHSEAATKVTCSMPKPLPL